MKSLVRFYCLEVIKNAQSTNNISSRIITAKKMHKTASKMMNASQLLKSFLSRTLLKMSKVVKICKETLWKTFRKLLPWTSLKDCRKVRLLWSKTWITEGCLEIFGPVICWRIFTVSGDTLPAGLYTRDERFKAPVLLRVHYSSSHSMLWNFRQKPYLIGALNSWMLLLTGCTLVVTLLPTVLQSNSYLLCPI